MGEHNVYPADDEARTRTFTRAVLEEIRALELMTARGMIETAPRRVGVEQEMFLTDRDGRAAPLSQPVLARLPEPNFTSELARFNLEVNLDPQSLDANFLGALEQRLTEAVDRVRAAAAEVGGEVILTGILPSLTEDDLTLANLSPDPRFRYLNDVISRARGGAIKVAIDGPDPIEVTLDSVMLEGASTSLQLHLQVDPAHGAALYNLAQLTAAPLLAAASNSPVLLGRRLWHETRVAVFERAVDFRSDAQVARRMPPRVCFGEGWLRQSLLEVFHDNAARYPVIMTLDAEPDPRGRVAAGVAPRLSALCLHNGTVWRWNRPCYAVADGRASLRIESRVLPAGPTIRDEVANAALFYGLMLGLAHTAPQIPARLRFEDAKANFVAAAQHGLAARFVWTDGQTVSAQELLLEELLPRARAGLADAGVSDDDAERFLGIVEERVATGRTGSNWLLESVRDARHLGPELWREAVILMSENQGSGDPVHRWSLSALQQRSKRASSRPRTVADIMTRDVFTVRPDDIIDLATSVMSWKHIRHIPVEDERGELVGLLSARELLSVDAHAPGGEQSATVAVKMLMRRDPVTVAPGTPLSDAMARLLETDAGCVLVTSGGRLLGIATERDFLRIALELVRG